MASKRDLHRMSEILRCGWRAIQEVISDPLSVARKEDSSLVTNADRRAEQAIVEAITRWCPNHAILAEESSSRGDPREGWCWTVDPIDGTDGLVQGLEFAIMVGLLRRGEPIMGGVMLPWRPLPEIIVAHRGQGCWLISSRDIETRITVRRTSLQEAWVLIEACHNLQPSHETLDRLLSTCFRRRFVGDAVGHLNVARGFAQVMIDAHSLKPWDTVPIATIVREAGGQVSDVTGKEDDILSWTSLVSSCGAGIHEQVIKLLR